MRVGRFIQDLTLTAFVIRFMDLEVLSLIQDFQQVAV